MSKYLTKHANQAAYEAVKDNLATPQVALTVDDNKVHYIPYSVTPPTPIIDGHEYVDLGLPSGTLWATMNVGASSVTDYGNYYDGDDNPSWSNNWHTPTKTQLEELTANTTYQWVTDYQNSGINGAAFTANGQTLFIPAAGIRSPEDGTIENVGNFAVIWSNTMGGTVEEPDEWEYYELITRNNGTISISQVYRGVGGSKRLVSNAA